MRLHRPTARTKHERPNGATPLTRALVATQQRMPRHGNLSCGTAYHAAPQYTMLQHSIRRAQHEQHDRLCRQCSTARQHRRVRPAYPCLPIYQHCSRCTPLNLRDGTGRAGPLVLLQAPRSAASRCMARSCASTWRSSSNSSERICTRLSHATSPHRARPDHACARRSIGLYRHLWSGWPCRCVAVG
jgi:hypothetical protein